MKYYTAKSTPSHNLDLVVTAIVEMEANSVFHVCDHKAYLTDEVGRIIIIDDVPLASGKYEAAFDEPYDRVWFEVITEPEEIENHPIEIASWELARLNNIAVEIESIDLNYINWIDSTYFPNPGDAVKYFICTGPTKLVVKVELLTILI